LKWISDQSTILSGWFRLDKRQLSHDILNMLERLRIMHDLAKDQNFSVIKKEELISDLDETLKKLEKDLRTLIQ
jgi:hypothetical protein